MASFTNYRSSNTNRSLDDPSKDLRSNIRESRLIQPEQWQSPEIQDKFDKGSIDFAEVHSLLQQLGIKVQKFELDTILEKHDRNKDKKLSKEEFENLYVKLRAEKDPGSTWGRTVKPTAGGVDRFVTRRDATDDPDAHPSGVEQQQEASGPYHSVLVEERVWTSNWLNQLLADDSHLNLHANPIDSTDPQALYKRCQDGILLCKLINIAVPKTIDERAINLNLSKQDIFRQGENLELAINSARGIGCKVVNIHPENISKAVPHLVMGLLWQIIRIQLTSEINLKHVPGLVLLLRDGETPEDLLKLSPEELLLRWVNYQLKRSQYSGKPVTNFSGDIKDSEAYTHLLSVIAPANTKPPVGLTPLKEDDLRRRAELMLKEADKIKARAHITPEDVVKGNPRLNFAFVANLFNTYPTLDLPTEQVPEPGLIIEETREEKTYRNFINSLGLEPHVNYLYSDLCDGLIILQLYDIIRPNTVDWSKIYKTFNAIKERFQKLNNCNFAVDYAVEPLHFKMTGIGGPDILEGNKTLTLGLVWQIMRAYTLSILQKLAQSTTPIADKDIINWANQKLKSANKKTVLTNFQDHSLSDSMLICDLIDAIKPGSIQYNLLKTAGTPEAKMDNALYAISMSRKIGARIYALPEDIVETKQKMLLTVFACLMAKHNGRIHTHSIRKHSIGAMVDDLRYWHASDGEISVSTERFKHGTSSLKWVWSSSSLLTYTNPNVFRATKWANNICFGFWLYNEEVSTLDENNPPQPLYVEFLTQSDPEPIARLWYHVNFYGWRPLGLRYTLLPQFKNNLSRIHGIRFYPPANISSGVYYINAFNIEFKHAIGPQDDYQQPWATQEYIQRLSDEPSKWLFNSNNIFHNRPWLSEHEVNASADGFNKLKDRWLASLPYGTWSPSTKPEPFSKLQTLAAPYGIKPHTISNVPLGKGGFHSPTNALEIQPFLLGPLKRTATTFQCHRHSGSVDSEEGQNVWGLLVQLCEYLLEQGWAEGNRNLEGHLDIGYEIRNFPMCLTYIRNELNEADTTGSIFKAAMWIMYGHLLTEQEASIMNTDIIHNYLTNVSRLIVCLSDQTESIHRISALRYVLDHCFETRIHEPLALDGTVHHHWMCHYEYASYALPDIVKFASEMNDTEFRFSNNIRRIIRRCIFTLNFCLIENEKIPANLNARAGNCVLCNGLNLTKKCISICNEGYSYDPFFAGLLITLCPKNDKNIATYLEDHVEPIPLDGHLTLNSTSASIHRRSNFFVAVVGMGKNRRGLEIYGWLQESNSYGEYARNCSVFLVPANNQGVIKYSNAGCGYPGWNWSHWPGTTCLIKPPSELFEGYCNLTAKNWLAGGTSIAGRDGMFSNDFLVFDIAFRRSVYCFDNRITVLTTNLKLLQQIKRPVVTTLFQSNFSNLENAEQTPFILNNDEIISEFPYENSFENHDLYSVTDHRKITYYLHSNENSNQSYRLVLRRSQQEMIYLNQSYLIDPKDNPIIDIKAKHFREAKYEDNEKYFKPTKDNYGLGYIEHLNVDDGTASFVYTILIGHEQSNQWMEEFSHSSKDPWASTDLTDLPPSLILSKSDDTHIFYDRDTDTTCYTCYSTDRLEVNIGLVRSFEQPCMAMVRGRGPGTITVSIATTDFTFNKTMSMVLKGKWVDAELQSDDENGSVHVRTEATADDDTKVTVWQRIYMPVEFEMSQRYD
ncbi:unnamed protein product [Rotaria socialis]|uniref:Uncharacterized protein n=7 Tax=Rotaria TaxID=231623 RepID=A0A817VKS4_9BILA|nr:unnamed protein product [Rotaria socialis]CAF4353837.1 unnamed protein product [Rotaria socialis]